MEQCCHQIPNKSNAKLFIYILIKKEELQINIREKCFFLRSKIISISFIKYISNMISIIYSYRNLDCQRLQLSLESLAKQRNQNFEVILVDFGSNTRFREAIKNVVSNFTFARYIYTYTENQIWSRSKALNLAIKESKFDKIFSSDVDMIFDEELINRLLGLYDEEKAIHFKVGYLKENFKLPIKKNDITSYSSKGAQGILLFSKTKAFQITGYDEFMCGWGCEDNDFLTRLKSIGVVSEFHENVLVYHQWHHKFIELKDTLLTQNLAIMNVLGFNYFKLQRNIDYKIIEVNKKWGEKITEDQYNELFKSDSKIEIDTKKAAFDFLINDLDNLAHKKTHIIILDKSTKQRFKFLKVLAGKNTVERTHYSMKFINDSILKKLIFIGAKNYYYKVDSGLKRIELRMIP